jgi:hypothetical protein
VTLVMGIGKTAGLSCSGSVERWMFMMERDEKIELIAVLQCCIHCIYRC